MGSHSPAGQDHNRSRIPPVIPDHELLKKIGRGSYGEVWLARSVTGQHRAVKLVYRDAFDNERPFTREFSGIQTYEPISRSHPGLMNILHVGKRDAEGYFYCIMELADDLNTGQKVDRDRYTPRTLREELKQRRRLPVVDCLRIGQALAAALEHLHQGGLVHRDIKPSNIIMVNGQPKLADIGLVASQDSTMSFVGTEGYIPREGPGTPQADLFSLGKVLYEISTGKGPLDYPNLPTDLVEMPDREMFLGLNEVIVKCCHSDATQRYGTAADVAADLRRVLDGLTVASPWLPTRLPQAGISKRVATIGVAAICMAVAAYAFWRRDNNRLVHLREIEVAGMDNFAGALPGDWDGDGQSDIANVAINSLMTFTSSGRMLGNQIVCNWDITLDMVHDVDQDGNSEAFVNWREGTNLFVAVYDHRMRQIRKFHAIGGLYQGSPTSTLTALAVDDLDLDGRRELLAYHGSGYGRIQRALYCFDYDTQEVRWRYPIGPFLQRVVVMDVNQDGKKDVVFGTNSPGNGNTAPDGSDDEHVYLYAVSHDGRLLWRRELGGLFMTVMPYLVQRTPSAEPQIIAQIHRHTGVGSAIGRLVLFNLQGEPLREFDAGATICATTVGDVDGDGNQDVVTANAQGQVFLLNTDLTARRQYRVCPDGVGEVVISRIVIANLEGSGRGHVVFPYTELDAVAGHNPRGDTGARNLRILRNNAVVVLDHTLDEKYRYTVADKWMNDRRFTVHVADFDRRHPGREILAVADKAVLLQYR